MSTEPCRVVGCGVGQGGEPPAPSAHSNHSSKPNTHRVLQERIRAECAVQTWYTTTGKAQGRARVYEYNNRRFIQPISPAPYAASTKPNRVALAEAVVLLRSTEGCCSQWYACPKSLNERRLVLVAGEGLMVPLCPTHIAVF